MNQTTATPQNVLDTVTGIVATELGVDAASVSPDLDLRAVEGMDSVRVLRTLARIEREFDVELEDEDIFAASTTGQIAALVEAARA